MMRPLKVQLLVLGGGWTYDFLGPLLKEEKVSHAATSTTGRDGTVKFVFDPDSDDLDPYRHLPQAAVVLITFPLKGDGQSKKITTLYEKTHGGVPAKWVQLGSTGIFTAPHWNDETSDHDKSNARAIAEDELIGLGGCVLNLAGLYGGARDPKNWLTRVAKSKEQVKGKNALHLIHGDDVARAIVAVHRNFGSFVRGTVGKRWLLTDMHVYDWWDLIFEWGDEVQKKLNTGGEEALEYRKWVLECMEEEGVRALPRSNEKIGRVLDSREFWRTMGTWPSRGRVA